MTVYGGQAGLTEDLVWKRYCGFMDLSLHEWEAIQARLLLEELEMAARSPWRARLPGGAPAASVEEFRARMPLTTYDDYDAYLSARRSDELPAPPAEWAYTVGRAGKAKWVPYTAQAIDRLADSLMAAFLVAAAREPGDVRVHGGEKVIYNVAPPPYLAGLVARVLQDRFKMRGLPPLAVGEQMGFQERLEQGFRQGLHSGVDLLCSLSSVLVRMGEYFTEHTRQRAETRGLDLHPMALARMAMGRAVSMLQRRPLLPRDLWRVRGIVAWGLDTSLYRSQIAYYWGKEPCEFYACTEAGIIAVQGFAAQGLYPIPYTAFLEFLPEEGAGAAGAAGRAAPRTVLLHETVPGQRYELVVTSFYGMPLLRYRTGHLLRVLGPATPGGVPLVAQVGRSDNMIDLAGFTRLDEKTLWEAVAPTSEGYTEWVAVKEFLHGKPVLHLYLERPEGGDEAQVADRIHEGLKALSPGYHDMATMLRLHPITVTFLAPGSLRAYQRKRATATTGLVSRVNPPPAFLEGLLKESGAAASRARVRV